MDSSRICSRGLDRRGFLSGVALLSGGLPLLAETKPKATVIAKTTHGQVRGAVQDGLNIFKGIPYAGAPAGEFRFKAAPPLQPWSGVRDALTYGPQSIQAPDPAWPKDWKPAPSDEACLFLNIWTPGVKDGKRRPIMFYSHGGGFASGNGGAEVWPQNLSHDGAGLAKSYDVVVVTHNHRLNLFGYLYLGELLGEEYAASGCAGMLDIAAALDWVRKNAEAFGGDPDRIMIWGESGGGAKTAALTAMPVAHGNFHRVSIESGPALRMQEKDKATEMARRVLSKLGLQENQARQLLTIPAAQLSSVEREVSARGKGKLVPISGVAMGFAPVMDGHFLPTHPFDPVASPLSAKVPMIVGINKDETIFLLRGDPTNFSLDEAEFQHRMKAFLGDKTSRVVEVYRKTRPQASRTDLAIAITTAYWMGTNAIRIAERKVQQHAAPVYSYVFAYESEVRVAPSVDYPQKSAHAMEMAFKFNHVDSSPSAGKRPERYKAARNMSRAWATFARTGNPSHDEIPAWPAYNLQSRPTMIMNAECQVVNDPNREERLLWESLDRESRTAG